MAAKVSAFLAMSLDGFIARKNGDLDWLDAASARLPPGEDGGYGQFIETVDVLVMGRHTYDKVCSFTPWPYDDLPVIVLSRRAITPVVSTVTHSQETPAALCQRLGDRHLYVDGGNTVQRFLQARQLDEITLTLIPILLGKGIPLFSPLTGEVPLQSLESRTYGDGLVQIRYRVVKP